MGRPRILPLAYQIDRAAPSLQSPVGCRFGQHLLRLPRSVRDRVLAPSPCATAPCAAATPTAAANRDSAERRSERAVMVLHSGEEAIARGQTEKQQPGVSIRSRGYSPPPQAHATRTHSTRIDTHIRTYTCAPTHNHSLAVSLTDSLMHSFLHSCTYSITLSPTPQLTRTYTHKHSLTNSLALSLFPPPSLSLSLTHTHTQTHLHTQCMFM